MDISGKIVEEKEESFTGSLTIDCGAWQAGLYFISISTNQSRSHFKFVKE